MTVCIYPKTLKSYSLLQAFFNLYRLKGCEIVLLIKKKRYSQKFTIRIWHQLLILFLIHAHSPKQKKSLNVNRVNACLCSMTEYLTIIICMILDEQIFDAFDQFCHGAHADVSISRITNRVIAPYFFIGSIKPNSLSLKCNIKKHCFGVFQHARKPFLHILLFIFVVTAWGACITNQTLGRIQTKFFAL